MKENANRPNINEEKLALQKKTKRIEESRAAIKAKSREKGKIIKAYQDRQTELETNRDDWKVKCKKKEKECMDVEDKYKQVADLLNMKEEQLKLILKEFEDFKKKYPLINQR